LLKREQATVAAFKKLFGRHYIAHVSTHGVLQNPPTESYLSFGKESDPKARLRVADLAEMMSEYPRGVQTQMVVLSACSTKLEAEIESGGSAIGPAEIDALSEAPLNLAQNFVSLD